MNVTTIDPEVRDYLEEVRSHLSDLPEDELDDLAIDLEAHLAEVAAEDAGSLRDRLGPPEAYARELRATAGFGPAVRARKPSWLRSRLELGRARLDELAASDAAVRARELWQQARPLWVAVRGWLLVVLWLITIGNHVVFDRFPIPRLGNNFMGLGMVAAVTVLSVTAARRAAGDRRWRLTDGGLTALTLLLMVSTLVAPVRIGEGTVAAYVSEISEADLLAQYPVAQARNIYAYDLEGNPLDGVLLYDQDGSPIDLYPWHDPGSFPEVRFAEDRFGQPVKNAYPLTMLAHTDHTETGEPVWVEVLAPRVPLPQMPAVGAEPPAPAPETPPAQHEPR